MLAYWTTGQRTGVPEVSSSSHHCVSLISIGLFGVVGGEVSYIKPPTLTISWGNIKIDEIQTKMGKNTFATVNIEYPFYKY